MARPTASEFKLSPWRFAVVAGVFFVSFAANWSFAIYGSVTPSAADRYAVSQAVINNLTLYYTAVFLIFEYACMWLLDNAVGQLALLHIGHAMLGAACPFTISAPTIAAAAWFSGEGRLLANTVMTLAGPLSAAVANGVAPLIVTSDASSVDTLNLIVFVVTVVLGFTSLLVYDKPPTPPSRSEAEKSKLTLSQSLKEISGNRYFWILTTVFAVVTGVLNVTSTVISSFVVPYGYTEDDSGNIAVAAIASGLVGALTVGFILDKTKKHRIGIKIMAFLSFVGFTLATVSFMNISMKLMAFFGAIIFGFGGMPSMALSMELGVECSFPVGENVSTGIQWSAAQLFSMILLVVSNYARNANVFILSLLFNPHNRRMALEGVEAEKREDEVQVAAIVDKTAV
ncbi:Major facilitator super domain-containing protein 7 [Entophlyctis luteolus]|nr:Major facilitator super domain-containing protein 7 [Entophlyctis luteolus]